MKYRFARIVVILAIVSISSCGPFTREVVSRFPSPDGRVEAIWCRTSGGMTGSLAYTLYISEKTVDPDLKCAVLLVDHIHDVNISWTDDRVLQFEFEYARIFQYRNFWHSADVDDFSYVVEIRLKPRNEDHLLSPRDRWQEGDST